MKITEFYNTDYVDQASYDNLRKIGSAIDGQKNASRKVLYTILEKNIKNEIKVSQLNSKMAEFAEYLHGDASGVIVTLAKNYAGTNNIPLLVREGNFGTRFANEASAPRYIYTNGSSEFFELFKKEDTAVLKKQSFEGQEIEPMFYVPALPMLLINGSEGVSSGFAQKILSREPKKIKKYITDTLSNSLRPNKSNSLEPYFEGFNGVVEQGENSAQWLIKGTIERKGPSTIVITEVPIGYDLKGYINVLDDLEDRGAFQSYRDLSENDVFKFEVKFKSTDLKKFTDEDVLQKLKLIKKVTENYTAMDADNKIREFQSAKEILDYYIDIKLKYLQLRKDNLIQKIDEEIRYDFSRYLFIKNIVEETLKVNKRKKVDIEQDLNGIENILERDGSYDYLLSMAIHSLTEERMAKLEQQIKDKKAELEVLKSTTIEDIWNKEL